jgi:hypothetical protein
MIQRAIPLLVLLECLEVRAQPAYVPPAPEQVTNYFATVLPCELKRGKQDDDTTLYRREPGYLDLHPALKAKFDRANKVLTFVKCKDGFLENKTLRELAILRNTIYSRYGWDGYRKPWLRDYFHAQPWFKPNPRFSYKLISEVDKKNAHLIGAREQSLTERELDRMRLDVYARHGKVWHDVPEWILKNRKTLTSCKAPPSEEIDWEATPEEQGEDDSWDCRYQGRSWYKANPAYSDALLTSDDRIELGLISRALGQSVVLGREVEKAGNDSPDRLYTLGELRQLSLRDLRLLRNTLYARHGRKFKSQILQDHFDGMSWYQLDPKYSDKLLTKNDQRNIALIKSVENEFGGPLTDDDWLTEPLTDGA